MSLETHIFFFYASTLVHLAKIISWYKTFLEFTRDRWTHHHRAAMFCGALIALFITKLSKSLIHSIPAIQVSLSQVHDKEF